MDQPMTIGLFLLLFGQLVIGGFIIGLFENRDRKRDLEEADGNK